MFDGRRLKKQLEPLGEDQANILTTLTMGVQAMFEEHPILRNLLAQHAFGVIAVMYGIALRECIEMDDDRVSPSLRRSAKEILPLLPRLVELANQPDPEPMPSIGAHISMLDALLQRVAAERVGELPFDKTNTVGPDTDTIVDGEFFENDDPGDEDDGDEL